MSDITDDAGYSGSTEAENRNYLLRRAEDHDILARKAIDPSIRSVHRLLQGLYEKRALNAEMTHSD